MTILIYFVSQSDAQKIFQRFLYQIHKLYHTQKRRRKKRTFYKSKAVSHRRTISGSHFILTIFFHEIHLPFELNTFKIYLLS